jgi:hypothetical protein
MNEAGKTGARHAAKPKAGPDLLEQYGCGPIQFSGADDRLYERHLLFDDVLAPAKEGVIQSRFWRRVSLRKDFSLGMWIIWAIFVR